MRFTISAAALLAFASSAFAQTDGFDPITKPTKDENVKAGSTYEIDWTSSSKYTGSVTITLLGGSSPSTLETVSTIATGVDNSLNKYSWAVDLSLGKAATYGIQITLDSDKSTFQYSFPFHIVGGSGSNSTSSSTGSSSGTATVTISSKSSSSASLSTHSTSAYTTMTPASNYTATQSPTIVTSTKTASGSSGSSASTTSPGTVSTGAAAQVAAGSVAMLGGLALAVFAL